MVTGEPMPVNAPQSFAAGAAGAFVTTGADVTAGAFVTGVVWPVVAAGADVAAGAFVTTGATVTVGELVTGGTTVVVPGSANGVRFPCAPTMAGRSSACTMPTPTVVSARAGNTRRTMDGLR